MYLKLSVAGHLTIFLTRTRGPFWSIRPARILWIAVLGTQAIATLIAVYGLFMTPLGWRWAGFVWGYAIICALATDRVKLLAYKILDPVKDHSKPQAKSPAKPEAKAEAKPEAKAEPKPEAKAEAKPEAKAEPKPEAKAESKPEPKSEPKPEVKTQIAKRAYELYEERGSKAGHSVQDWEKAEQEIQKDEAKAEPKPEANTEPKSEANTEPKPEVKAKAELPADLKLHIVKRVHELYEELGREDVREVEEWEKAARETPENGPHK